MEPGVAVDGWLRRLGFALLPARCLLCGAAAAGRRDLCAACAADLPRNTQACAGCGLPLATPAPRCGRCLKRPPAFATAWVPFVYAPPLAGLVTRFKFAGDLAAGRVLAELLVAQWRAAPPTLPAALVPVPLHATRLRERGYNQALELARPLARATGLALLRDGLRRERPTPAQSGLGALARRRNLRGAFRADPDLAWPRHVALVDDVVTTGATAQACTRALREAGVERVDVWALARVPV